MLLALSLLIASALALTGCESRKKDITGVTTLTKENTVIMNSPTGDEFVNGSGKITVSEGETLHLTYDLTEGSMDLALNAGDGTLDVFETVDLENLGADGQVFGVSGITEKGELVIDAAPGEYTVFFNLHSAAGTATVSAASK